MGRRPGIIKKYFDRSSEARVWLNDAKYADQHNDISAASGMTVQVWFEYWIKNVKEPTVRFNTVRNYRERYEHNIRKYLGHMILSDVKPMHCQHVLNVMKDRYAGSTIEQCRITMCSMFYYAVINNLIPTNPANKMVKLPKPVVKKVRFLALNEQEKLLEAARDSSNFPQFLLVMQTGLRTGEMMGLKWQDIDFDIRKIHVQRTLEYRYGYQEFHEGEPKTKHGYRTVPMTQIAYDLLKSKYDEIGSRKVSDERYAEYVFLNPKGSPTKNSVYDTTLYKLCQKAGIPTVSMHTLRHTYATRCIEAGMRPKTLQEILGHANIGIIMNLYVHNTEEEKEKEIRKFEEAFQNHFAMDNLTG